ncbi:MAG: arsenate reductase (glutaredoxin) [Arenicellales bacterium]
MSITIYHNPRCSKSRRTLQLLAEHDVDVDIVEYLKTPPDVDELTRIIDLLGLEPRQVMRIEEPVYKEKGFDDPTLSRRQLIEAMVGDPVLIQRPIVIAGDRARIGRPPEAVLEII